MQKEIYLIRHGETDLNRQGILQGRGVDGALNEKGREQARAFFAHYRHIPFQMLLSSCLRRSYQTLQPFIELDIKWHALPELDEIDWGIHEGKPFSEWMTSNYEKLVAEWNRGNYHASIEEGESAYQLAERVDRFLEYVASLDTGPVLVCSHGRTIRCLLSRVQGEPLAEMEKHSHENTGLFHLSAGPGGFELLSYNDTKHLYSETYRKFDQI